jgi:hypothetical protein
MPVSAFGDPKNPTLTFTFLIIYFRFRNLTMNRTSLEYCSSSRAGGESRIDKSDKESTVERAQLVEEGDSQKQQKSKDQT